MTQVLAGVDVVITTALIPGKRAPLLITEEAVSGMQHGSVIVDCTAERGGNCELTRPNVRVVTANGVTILGPTNLPATVPHEASLMYSKNMTAFLLHLVKDRKLDIDFEDEIVKGRLLAHAGEIVHKNSRRWRRWDMSNNLEVSLFIFVLASFLGFTVITRVPGLLHTPLMSLTNAISAISLVGSLILAGAGEGTLVTVLGSVAVFAAMTNVVSGFLITDRMLKMFRRRESPKEQEPAQPPQGMAP